MGGAMRIKIEDGVAVLRLDERLDLDSLFEAMTKVAHTYKGNKRLWDVTDAFFYTTEEVKRIAAHGRAIWPGAARVAFLAVDDLSYGHLRMLTVYREHEQYETRVFRERLEAMAWLKGWDG